MYITYIMLYEYFDNILYFYFQIIVTQLFGKSECNTPNQVKMIKIISQLNI